MQRTTFGRKLQKTIGTIKKYEKFISTDKATSRSTLNFNNSSRNTFASNIISFEKYLSP